MSAPETRAEQIALKTLRGEYDLLLACCDLARLRLHLPSVKPEVIDLFVGVASDVNDLPLGDVREHWSPDPLRLKDLEAADHREQVGGQVKEALQELLVSLDPAALVRDLVSRLPLDLNLSLLCLRLGILPESRVHEVATVALMEGMDSPALRRLAGALEPTGMLLSDLADGIASAGINPPLVDDALRGFGVAIARRIVQGHLSPIEGATILFRTHVRHHDIDLVELHPFIYIYSEWEDRPGDHVLFESMIVQGAVDLVAAWGK